MGIVLNGYKCFINSFISYNRYIINIFFVYYRLLERYKNINFM